MNRLAFTLFLLLLGHLSFAQIYSEDFSNGMPSDYIIIDRDGNTPASQVAFITDAWIVSPSGRAVSTSYYSPPGTSDDWMITSEITLPTPGAGNSLFLTWKEYTPDAGYPDGYLVKINASGQTEPDSFTTILTVPEAGLDWTAKSLDLTSYSGQTIRLAFVNNSNDKFLLYIDDIAIYEVGANNMAITNNLNPSYKQGGTDKFKVELTNLGYDGNNVDLSYSVDGGSAVTETISFTNFGFLSTQEVEHPTAPNLSQGTHDVKMWISNPNGMADIDTENDTIDFQVVVYDAGNTVERHTVMEVFTSSTCPPCKGGNEQINTVLNGLTVQPSLVKYQQDFPGAGDPYATEETVNRRHFYGISAIPTAQIDGAFNALNPNGLTADDVIAAQAEGALAVIDAQYELDTANQSIRIFGSYTPKVDLVGNTRMILAIKEKKTFNNVKSNGETEFIDVVKKLYNGNPGIALAGKMAGQTYNFDYTYQFQGNYRLPNDAGDPIDHSTEHSVEEFSDLAATVFIEEPNFQLMLQADEADLVVGLKPIEQLGEVSLFPNPTRDMLNVNFALQQQMPVTVNVIDMTGKVVLTENLGSLPSGEHQHQLNVSSLPSGTYDLSILSDGRGFSTTFTISR